MEQMLASMKRILYILILCSPIALSAQNWQNICSPGVTLYQNVLGEIQTFRLDSIQTPGNGDTVFYSYHTIREQEPCADTSNGSVIGYKVYKTSGGWFFFFNRSWDTLHINATASLNEHWKFCDLPDSGFIEANVSGVQSDTIFGIEDSVKVIAFQAYDSTGNPISHALNGKHFTLRRTYGLTEIADVYLLPDTFSKYKLVGKTLPETGIANLNEQVIYDFDVGDEFHYQGGDTPQQWYTTSIYWKRMITILTKEVSQSGNSYIYQASRCMQLKIDPWGSSEPPYVENFRDTITFAHPFSSSLTDTSRMQLPGTFIRRNWIDNQVAYSYSRDFNGPNGRQKQIMGENYYMFRDSCWEWSGYHFWSEYAAGVGCILNEQKGGNLYLYLDKLVYYKKGEEEWGTRLAADCDQLLGTNEFQISNFKFQFSVFPNPAKELITVQVDSFTPGDIMEFKLFDFLGREVYQTTIRQSHTMINLSNLSNLSKGIYIWQVTGEAGTAMGKLMLE